MHRTFIIAIFMLFVLANIFQTVYNHPLKTTIQSGTFSNRTTTIKTTTRPTTKPKTDTIVSPKPKSSSSIAKPNDEMILDLLDSFGSSKETDSGKNAGKPRNKRTLVTGLLYVLATIVQYLALILQAVLGGLLGPVGTILG